MNLPILAITAYSGTGKTTLLKALIPALLKKGLKVSVIKHAHHQFDIDTPGKDSYEVRKAGAVQTLVASSRRWALMTETPEQDELNIQQLLTQLDPKLCDLVLLEGFKGHDVPKLVLHRSGTQKPLPEITPNTLAIISDEQQVEAELPLLNINAINSIADYIYSCWQSGKLSQGCNES